MSFEVSPENVGIDAILVERDLLRCVPFSVLE